MKKQWGTPELMELNINETAHSKLWGAYYDGGYIGDGHLGWFTDNPDESPCHRNKKPNNPTEPKS